jgi:hypothetical protein
MTYIPWTDSEDATLLAEYNASGFAAAQRALPDRSGDAIKSRIRKLRAEGVSIVHRLGRNSARVDAVKRPNDPRALPMFDSTGFLEQIALRIPSRANQREFSEHSRGATRAPQYRNSQ